MHLFKRFVIKKKKCSNLLYLIPFHCSLQNSTAYSSSHRHTLWQVIALPTYSSSEMIRFISLIKEGTVLRTIQLVYSLEAQAETSAAARGSSISAVCCSMWMSFLSFSSYTVYFPIYASKESFSKGNMLIMSTQN